MASMSATRVTGLCRRQATPAFGSRSSSRAPAARILVARATTEGKVSVGLASVAASGVVAGAARADEAAIASAVQAAEAAVEQVAEVIALEVPNNATLIEEVNEAVTALQTAEASSDGAIVAQAVNEAAAVMKEVSAAATDAGAGVDVLSAVAAATAAIQEATVAALEATGVDAAAVAATAAAGAATASGLAQKAYVFLTTTEPTLLAEDALGAVAFTYLAPPLAKLGFDKARGYSGDVLPTTALDSLVSEAATIMVDIRDAADKQKNGVPDLPNNDKLVELEYVRLEGADDLRDPANVCAESTAVRIAALKKLNTSRTLYIMDESGSGTAKAVARQLRKRGYGKVFVVSGGAAAWLAAKLRTRPWNAPAALLPSTTESKIAAAIQPEVEAQRDVVPDLAAAVEAQAEDESKVDDEAGSKAKAKPEVEVGVSVAA